jgi:DNA-binding transcriptional LysR family regulator
MGELRRRHNSHLHRSWPATAALHLYALYPPTRHLAAKVRLFIDFLAKRFES